MREIRVYGSAEAVADGAAAFLLDELRRHAATRRFALALSGGETPRALYRRLALQAEVGSLLKEKGELFFSDERAVPPGHPDSNFGMAKRTLLDPLGLDQRIVHRMRGEADVAIERSRYADELRDTLRTPAGEYPALDLILLGMGEDGHTASLFPELEADDRSPEPVVGRFVMAVGGNRLSLSLGTINAARIVLFLVTGERKAAMVKKVLCPEGKGGIPPAAKVAAARTIWMLDSDAARLLDRRMVEVHEV